MGFGRHGRDGFLSLNDDFKRRYSCVRCSTLRNPRSTSLGRKILVSILLLTQSGLTLLTLFPELQSPTCLCFTWLCDDLTACATRWSRVDPGGEEQALAKAVLQRFSITQEIVRKAGQRARR